MYQTSQDINIILVLQFRYDCQTKFEKLSDMLVSAAAKVKEETGPGTKAEVFEMLFGPE